MSIKKDVVWRVRMVFWAVCLVGLLIAVKIAYIQTAEHQHWIEVAEQSTIKFMPINAERGNVYSEDGRQLATSIPYFKIHFDLLANGISDDLFNEQVDSLALCMHNFFGNKSKTAYKKELIQAKEDGKRYYKIASKVSYDGLKEMKTWPIFRRGRNGGGFISEMFEVRDTPYKMLAHRTIGYVRENAQSVGLEASFDNYLAGKRGKRLMQKIAGAWIPVNDEEEISSVNGKDLITTLDVNLQDILETELLAAIDRHKANHGSAILMEVETGKIKAIANIGKNENDDYWEQYNYAIGEATEPGSTFKLATMMALLEDGYISIYDSVDLEKGKKRFYDRWMKDSEKHDKRMVTIKEAFAISSNVAAAKLAYDHYHHQPKKFINHLKDLGLHQPLGIEIKGEPTPIIKHPDSSGWSGITIPWMAVGYELTQTPLQTLTLYNAIANDGKMMKPYLVNSIMNFEGVVKEFEPQTLNSQICSEKTLAMCKELLEEVHISGTAVHLRTEGFMMACKTGTSRIAKNNEGYGDKVYQSSMVAYFPADNPKYSCIVVVNAPTEKGYYGGYVAGPVIRNVAKKIYAYSLEMQSLAVDDRDVGNMPYMKIGFKTDLETAYSELGINFWSTDSSTWVGCQEKNGDMHLTHRTMNETTVPNVRGMGLRDAIYILENAGLRVRFDGMGKVRQQSIQPGVRIRGDQEIILELS